MKIWALISKPLVEREAYLHRLPEHLARQAELEAQGVLLAAGPLLDVEGNKTGAGLMLLRAETAEAAHDIAAEDPLHKDGFRSFELSEWTLKEGTLLAAFGCEPRGQ
ncbi:YciI family protein [Oceanicola sp. D3]|uniref:YciI family protein n=1 Tax=Oceanicola sp. D3 TaxID=2587163 RepID=UPI00143CE8DB|nr:YciI family protein [Oceanicola sp. D3]